MHSGGKVFGRALAARGLRKMTHEQGGRSQKFLFGLRDGYAIESVLIRRRDVTLHAFHRRWAVRLPVSSVLPGRQGSGAICWRVRSSSRSCNWARR